MDLNKLLLNVINPFLLFTDSLTKMPFGKLKKVSSSSDDKAMNISGPTEVKHNFHVGFDSVTGEFNGLPPAWHSLLQQANIS